LFRPRAGKDAIDGSWEDLSKEAQTKPGLKAKFHSAARPHSSNKQARAGRKMGRGVKKTDRPESDRGEEEKK
jgi:hypothetical protein